MWKLALVFAVIVLLLNRRWNLAYVLLLASTLLGLLFGMPVLEVLRQTWVAVIEVESLRLVAAVLLIAVLGELLRQVKSMQRLVDSLQMLIRDPRLVLGIIPALIGLLPMVGGAMMSAPMIEEIGSRLNLSPERKTFLNYWFRHVWEYVFPLYPALILIAGMTSVSLTEIMIAQAPLTVGAIAGGAVVGLRGIKRPSPDSPAVPLSERWLGLRELTSSIWPIALVIVLSLAFNVEVVLSLVIAIVLAAAFNRVGLHTVGQILRRGLSPTTALLVWGIMIFKHMVSVSGGADTLSTTLASWGIAPVITTVTVSFSIGLLTGHAIPMVAIGFPLLQPLFSGSDIYVKYVMLTFGAGFTGVLLSPIHLCLALTRQYFNAAWAPLYRLLLPSAAILALAVTLAWFVP